MKKETLKIKQQYLMNYSIKTHNLWLWDINKKRPSIGRPNNIYRFSFECLLEKDTTKNFVHHFNNPPFRKNHVILL